MQGRSHETQVNQLIDKGNSVEASSDPSPPLSSTLARFENVSYLPEDPQDRSIPIGLIGCGGITAHHLQAYSAAGYNVVALADIDRDRAEIRRELYYPEASVYESHLDLLARDDVAVVDIATHTDVRSALIEDALRARKHVLSQKPFVLDLDVGQRLVDLADRQQVLLAVNQNGRWAPHFSFARSAIEQGLLGDLLSANLTVHWDHTWVEGTPFEKIHHLILYDYAIHWFDIVSCFFAQGQAERVYATVQPTRVQTLAPPLLAQANLQFPDGAASLFFNAETHFGQENRMFLSGSEATVQSTGPSEREQTVTVSTDGGQFVPRLYGSWFPDGFHGTMGELLCSIEQKRQPSIDAARNLHSLELCFAAVASAESGEPMKPGSVRRLPS